jgi:hypothetical protein
MKLAYQDGMNDGEIMPAYNKEVNLALNDPTGACLDCHMLVNVRRA